MSFVTQTTFSGTVSSIIAAVNSADQKLAASIEDTETRILAEIRRVRTDLELRINENKAGNIRQDQRIDQVWSKIAQLDAKNASQDATDAQQWAAIKANSDWIDEVNRRLSQQNIDLGQALSRDGGGGGFSLPSFGTGLGTGALIVGAGVLALLILRR